MELVLKRAYLAFTIHNINLVCFVIYLIVKQSLYVMWWHIPTHNTALGENEPWSWKSIGCIVLSTSLAVVTTWAIYLQTIYANQGRFSVKKMKKFFWVCCINHLMFIAGPSLILLINQVEDENRGFIQLWSSLNLVAALFSQWQVYSTQNSIKAMDFLFFV